MDYYYRKFLTDSAESYLRAFRIGEICHIILRHRIDIIASKLPKIITSSDIDQGAYAYFLLQYGSKEQQSQLPLIVRRLIANNDPLGNYIYGSMLYFGIGVSVNQSLGTDYFKKASLQNLALAKFQLGKIMLNSDESRGMELIREAASQGYSDAKWFVGAAYYLGRYGYSQDKFNAFDFFSDGSNLNDPKCKYRLAIMYKNGEGYTDVDINKYIELMKEAAGLEDETAMMHCARDYYAGEYFPRSYDNSFYYFKQCAERGNLEAMYFLGRFYIEGIGCFPNEQEGLNWIRKAKDKGYKDAIEFLK